MSQNMFDLLLTASSDVECLLRFASERAERKKDRRKKKGLTRHLIIAKCVCKIAVLGKSSAYTILAPNTATEKPRNKLV